MGSGPGQQEGKLHPDSKIPPFLPPIQKLERPSSWIQKRVWISSCRLVPEERRRAPLWLAQERLCGCLEPKIRAEPPLMAENIAGGVAAEEERQRQDGCAGLEAARSSVSP